jgi:hypothetical protein
MIFYSQLQTLFVHRIEGKPNVPEKKNQCRHQKSKFLTLYFFYVYILSMYIFVMQSLLFTVNIKKNQFVTSKILDCEPDKYRALRQYDISRST